ncbi:hypothetical protein HRbin38_00354 [bacterium HR38]|nr:hypothetical protein HRbin38_00354 [bacterium HR38]
MGRPKTHWAAVSLGAVQRATEGLAALGLPQAAGRKSTNQESPVPWPKKAMASGPYSSLIFIILSATWSRASSQVATRYLPSPRWLPSTRIRGRLSRSGS